LILLQFHRTAEAPPNYLAWREQRKVLLWVLLIGVPMIAGLRAWDLWNAAPARPADEEAKIDPSLPWTNHSLTLDSFTAEPLAEHREAEPQENHNDDKFFRGVIPSYLESVRDDTLSRQADQDAFFNLFQTLNRAPIDELKAASLGPTTYVQLFRQPEAYRGRLVDLRGTVRRAHRRPLKENHTGLTHNYQLWFFPVDNPNNPIVVYSLDLPEGFPIGMKINEPVELTGFFLKRVAYGAQAGGMTAPMVLAKTVQWKASSPQDKAEAADRAKNRMQWLAGIAVIGTVVLAVVMWQLNRSLRRPMTRRGEMPDGAVGALHDADVTTVEEDLQRLSREEL
jgi:hypothetical protein